MASGPPPGRDPRASRSAALACGEVERRALVRDLGVGELRGRDHTCPIAFARHRRLSAAATTARSATLERRPGRAQLERRLRHLQPDATVEARELAARGARPGRGPGPRPRRRAAVEHLPGDARRRASQVSAQSLVGGTMSAVGVGVVVAPAQLGLRQGAAVLRARRRVGRGDALRGAPGARAGRLRAPPGRAPRRPAVGMAVPRAARSARRAPRAEGRAAGEVRVRDARRRFSARSRSSSARSRSTWTASSSLRGARPNLERLRASMRCAS